MKKTIILLMVFAVISIYAQKKSTLLIEAESFNDKGGWVVDQQSMDIKIGRAHV